CTGCGRCLDVCPGSLLYKGDDNKAYIRYPRDCWGCTACLKECSQGAIRYYLGADIGGKGTTLYTTKEKNFLNWHIEKANGEVDIININQKESNKY
ncbi:MAG TPA: ferredoxin family protein, partial [Clostridia bacterium]